MPKLLLKLIICAILITPLACSTEDDGGGGGTPEIVFTPVVGGILLPTGLTNAGDGSGRLFVTEKGGRVKIVKNGALIPQPFLDISRRVLTAHSESGLLDITFPPGYASKGYFYVNYVNRRNQTVISRFNVSGNPDIANPSSERILLVISRTHTNHYGGQMEFGPDGYLYIGVGDGSLSGNINDPNLVAQNKGSLLGKILRINVEPNIPGYTIPGNNPFVGEAGSRGEIWAYGLRNPWRFSFDRATGGLFIGDVMYDGPEAVYHQPAGSPGGQNYGWSILEGSECAKPELDCGQGGFTNPVFEYGHDQGEAVIGGYVYRGPGNCRMQGKYIFGDFIGKIWAMSGGDGGWSAELLRDIGDDGPGAASRDLDEVSDTEEHHENYLISSFGEGENGELYIVIFDIMQGGVGAIYQISDNGPQDC